MRDNIAVSYFRILTHQHLHIREPILHLVRYILFGLFTYGRTYLDEKLLP